MKEKNVKPTKKNLTKRLNDLINKYKKDIDKTSEKVELKAKKIIKAKTKPAKKSKIVWSDTSTDLKWKREVNAVIIKTTTAKKKKLKK